jgi:sugar O-acyltransferase (sialic acid O-acetyltransferase NeuD family)
MLLFGASGHAKVIYDCVISQGLRVTGVFDDNLDIKTFFKIKNLGKYDPNNKKNEEIIIGIGNNKIRQKIAKLITHKFGIITHSSTLISPSVTIGEGTVVFHGAIIQNSTKLGKHVIINTNSSVDHDCEIDDFVHIAPNVAICGGVSIGKGTLIGAGSVILPNITIGHNVIVGAGSVVLKDISNDSKVFGNPAKKYE